ncbi:creatininase family protein [Maribellus sp. CM-23]|uniref:creatininase family protein n=1 Tax=Maribellus sp. CM-23 TaxID=2781026 RepID=UPI001F2B66BF|nr:creatininase family protein [Maribellus sp. CM-23]MCE4565184.1 creatininase family protein [Maribellus sp. CM-23]
MKKLILIAFVFSSFFVSAQELPFRLEELTAPDFIKAVEKSSRTCVIPIGVMEKHGPHLPLGTDLFLSREYALRAAEKEYAVVFPWYYFSQINEARHQPGTISYSPELIWLMLQETLDELNRNGFEKIIIVNGHGGNNAFLNFFGMAQLSEPRNYSLYWFRPEPNREVEKKAADLTQHDPFDAHAGNGETSEMAAAQPQLAYVDRAGQQSGANLERMKNLQYVYTGIWWYASYPNHYGGDGSKANAEAGELLIDETVKQLVEMIQLVKADTVVPALQQEFFRKAEHPLDTKQ